MHLINRVYNKVNTTANAVPPHRTIITLKTRWHRLVCQRVFLFCALLVLNQVRQLRVCLDALNFVGYNLPDLVLDAVVVGVDLLLHGVVAVLVGEVDDLRNLHVAGGLPLDLLVIHDNLGMENLLLDTLVEVVGYRPDEHALREVGNLARRNEAVHLGVDGNGGLVPVDGHVLPFLQDLAETLGERLGGFGNYLTCKDIADRIANHSGLFVSIITL